MLGPEAQSARKLADGFRALCMHSVIPRRRAVLSRTTRWFSGGDQAQEGPVETGLSALEPEAAHRDYRSEPETVEDGANMVIPLTVMETVAVEVWKSPADPQRTL